MIFRPWLVPTFLAPLSANNIGIISSNTTEESSSSLRLNVQFFDFIFGYPEIAADKGNVATRFVCQKNVPHLPFLVTANFSSSRIQISNTQSSMERDLDIQSINLEISTLPEQVPAMFNYHLINEPTNKREQTKPKKMQDPKLKANDQKSGLKENFTKEKDHDATSQQVRHFRVPSHSTLLEPLPGIVELPNGNQNLQKLIEKSLIPQSPTESGELPEEAKKAAFWNDIPTREKIETDAQIYSFDPREVTSFFVSNTPSSAPQETRLKMGRFARPNANGNLLATKAPVKEIFPPLSKYPTSTVPEYKENIAVPKYKENIAVPKYKENIAVPKYKENIGVPEYKENIAVPEYTENIRVSRFNIEDNEKVDDLIENQDSEDDEEVDKDDEEVDKDDEEVDKEDFGINVDGLENEELQILDFRRLEENQWDDLKIDNFNEDNFDLPFDEEFAVASIEGLTVKFLTVIPDTVEVTTLNSRLFHIQYICTSKGKYVLNATIHSEADPLCLSWVKVCDPTSWGILTLEDKESKSIVFDSESYVGKPPIIFGGQNRGLLSLKRRGAGSTLLKDVQVTLASDVTGILPTARILSDFSLRELELNSESEGIDVLLDVECEDSLADEIVLLNVEFVNQSPLISPLPVPLRIQCPSKKKAPTNFIITASSCSKNSDVVDAAGYKNVMIDGQIQPLFDPSSQNSWAMIPSNDDCTRITIVSGPDNEVKLPSLYPPPIANARNKVVFVNQKSIVTDSVQRNEATIDIPYICLKEGVSPIDMEIFLTSKSRIQITWEKSCLTPQAREGIAMTASLATAMLGGIMALFISLLWCTRLGDCVRFSVGRSERQSFESIPAEF
eukprot:GHVP01009921.1.p1 GENE.GHVP01009921.1~~GHVP01009921.1.p1  ORF type:complete len:845 (+),score=195.86 GHVP01009921.1:886-3420(+)